MAHAAPTSDAMRPVQMPIVLSGVLFLFAGALYLGGDGWRFAALFVIGGLLGMSLYHASFGFTSAYRNAILRGDIAGITAQLLMIGLAMLLFAPFLATGEAFGRPVGGAVAPAGLRVAIGSFIFGLGMQLGGGCGSGTLGGGSTRMVVTLIAFCTGAFAGSLDVLQLPSLPSLGAVSFGKALGWPLAIALQAALLAALWLGFRRWAGDRPQRSIWGEAAVGRTLAASLQRWPARSSQSSDAVRRRSSLDGHLGLHALGGRGCPGIGMGGVISPFLERRLSRPRPRRQRFQRQHLDHECRHHAGRALIAAGLAGRFAPMLKIPFRSLLAAILGGLLMGYGARLGFGCNIGAFFSGAASFSLHAWIWIVFAFAGTWIGGEDAPLVRLYGLRGRRLSRPNSGS